MGTMAGGAGGTMDAMAAMGAGGAMGAVRACRAGGAGAITVTHAAAGRAAAGAAGAVDGAGGNRTGRADAACTVAVSARGDCHRIIDGSDIHQKGIVIGFHIPGRDYSFGLGLSFRSGTCQLPRFVRTSFLPALSRIGVNSEKRKLIFVLLCRTSRQQGPGD